MKDLGVLDFLAVKQRKVVMKPSELVNAFKNKYKFVLFLASNGLDLCIEVD